jgi:endonuclease YncB( thermonuclease family)
MLQRPRLTAPRGLLVLSLALAGCLAGEAPATSADPGGTGQSSGQRRRNEPQPRPHGSRVPVPLEQVEVDDGDTINIRWDRDDTEIIRILGIDTPETRHLEHNIPFAQPFGAEAQAFAEKTFAAARKVELLRSATLDPYGRTLGYVFVDGRNYSALVVSARLAVESVSHYGDNGLPKEAAEVLAAAEAAGPVPFEAPHRYRARMRELSEYMKEQGTYPEK